MIKELTKAEKIYYKFYDEISFLGMNNKISISKNKAKKCSLIYINQQIDYIENEMIGIDFNIRKIYIDELNDIKNEIKLL